MSSPKLKVNFMGGEVAIGGDTYQVKDALKRLGYRYLAGHWYKRIKEWSELNRHIRINVVDLYETVLATQSALDIIFGEIDAVVRETGAQIELGAGITWLVSYYYTRLQELINM